MTKLLRATGLVAAWLILLPAPAPAQEEPERRIVPTVKRDVRTWAKFNDYGSPFQGVVEEISEKGITVHGMNWDGPGEVSRTFPPVDLLADGKVDPNAQGSYAYRWSDVKKGDTVALRVQTDDVEKVQYCFRIRIERRPGAKVPESQDPKRDGRHAKDNLLNDIENGLDVSDDDIARLYPTKYTRDNFGRVYGVSVPGGLDAKFQEKLDAIRAKKAKEKELKAPPPEKK